MPRAHDLILTEFRLYDGLNNGNIALTWTDFDGLPGFGKKDRFYRHRRSVLASGILMTSLCVTCDGKFLRSRM